MYSTVEPDMVQFADRIVDEIQSLHTRCESEPPYLRRFDAYGKRVDEIVTSSAWKRQKGISAEEGLVAIPYENAFHQYRLVAA